MNPFMRDKGILACDFRVIPVSLCGKCYDDIRAQDDKYLIVNDNCTTYGSCEICGAGSLKMCFHARVKSKWQWMKKRGVI